MSEPLKFKVFAQTTAYTYVEVEVTHEEIARAMEASGLLEGETAADVLRRLDSGQGVSSDAVRAVAGEVAIDKGWKEGFPGLCHQCEGWRRPGIELGEWEPPDKGDIECVTPEASGS